MVTKCPAPFLQLAGQPAAGRQLVSLVTSSFTPEISLWSRQAFPDRMGIVQPRAHGNRGQQAPSPFPSLDQGADALEDEARCRAVAGCDVLLMFMLKGLRSQKWRESRTTIPPAELNKMIEAELQRIAKQKEVEALGSVN